eukprot:scaffold10557_cov72-Cyclotella_meneghiniana.AAC.7
MPVLDTLKYLSGHGLIAVFGTTESLFKVLTTNNADNVLVLGLHTPPRHQTISQHPRELTPSNNILWVSGQKLPCGRLALGKKRSMHARVSGQHVKW